MVGTVVTGSGPHAGDADVPRNGLDAVLLTNLHAAAVYGDGGGERWPAWSCCGAGPPPCCWPSRASRPASASLSTSSGCRSVWSSLHLLGASLAIAAGANLMLSFRPRREAPETAADAQAVDAARVAAARVDQPTQQHLGWTAYAGPLRGVRDAAR